VEAGHFALRRQGRVPKAVITELEHLLNDNAVGTLAMATLADMAWLGEPLVLDDEAGRQEAERLRNIIASSRPLAHPLQHYAEAALIVIGRPLGAQAVIEDFDARVAAANNSVPSKSVHKLLHLWTCDGVLSSREAFEYCETIRTSGRGLDYTEEELREGKLGRVGRP
jgi:hypothetical protein